MTYLSQEPRSDPVRISDLGELLAGLPVLFGFRPVDSLVVVCLDGPRGRVGFRLRADLPAPDVRDDLADYLVDVLRRNRASKVIVIACSGDPAAADPAVAVVVERLSSARIEVHDAVRCDGGRFWSYVCDNAACCPPEGRIYDEGSSRLVAEAVWTGMELLPDRQALADRVGPVVGEDRRRMEAATADAAVELFAASDGRDPATWQRDPELVDLGVRRMRSIVDRVTADPRYDLSDVEAATLAVWCSLDVVRNTAWTSIDVDNAADHLRVWSDVARRVVPPYEPAVLGLAGFSAWLSGDGALAWCAIERADQIDPDYSMTELLRDLLGRATPPSAWVPPTGDQVWQGIRRS